MLPLTGLSRRAFVVASALAATAPTATAARRRKPNPEAFLASAIQGDTIANGAFLWSYQAQVHHAAPGGRFCGRPGIPRGPMIAGIASTSERR